MCCAAKGLMRTAEVVDHIQPHRGNYELFADSRNWQPLCQPCHDQDKAMIEAQNEPSVVPEAWQGYLASFKPEEMGAQGGQKF